MSERKLLSYGKGITRAPSDDLCEDGCLAECINLEVKDENLVTVERPVDTGINIGAGCKLLFVHNTTSGAKNYIYQNAAGTSILYKEGGTGAGTKIMDASGVKSVNAIGNTLIVVSDSGMDYCLLKNGTYKHLGQKPPETVMRFSMATKLIRSDAFRLITDYSNQLMSEVVDGIREYTIKDEYFSNINGIAHAQINKFLAERKSEGYFVYPFFVRYAYRLFDGSHIMQSAPILMMPNNNIAPAIVAASNKVPDEYYVASFCSWLEYACVSNTTSLQDWSDIIKGVDIFLSTQFYTHDINGEMSHSPVSLEDSEAGKSRTHGWIMDSLDNTSWQKLEDAYQDKFGSGEYVAWEMTKRMEYKKEIESNALFYHVKSLALDELSSSIEYLFGADGDENNILGSLETRQVLEDDYMTHDLLMPQYAGTYNSRLNIANVKRKFFQGFNPLCLMPYLAKEGADVSTTVYVYIHGKDGDVVVKSETASIGTPSWAYFFYPDTDAYKMVIEYGPLRVSIPLVEHALLNGAFYSNPELEGTLLGASTVPSVTALQYETLRNELFTSEVNNPFYFPLDGINTVGTGDILGMTALTRPISQGQFGQFPLMVFCTDGNYALRVDEQGYYSGISPMQEDIILGNDKITPMEYSALVITKKGIMVFNSDEATSIIPQMDGQPFPYWKLSNPDGGDTTMKTILNACKDETGFLHYLYGSRMAYDYASNRVFIYNPEKDFCYIYRFGNATVSKFYPVGGEKITGHVSDYPDTLVYSQTGNVYSLYEKEDRNMQTVSQKGILVTRPLKLGNPLGLKSIKQVKHLVRASGKDFGVKYKVYGSYDNITYYEVGSRFGKPYKYYVLVIHTDLLPKDSFEGTILSIDERRNHKFR